MTGRNKKITASLLVGFGIVLIALFLRVNQLGRIPVGLTDDELREAYSASSLWKTGRGLTQNTLTPFLFVVNNYSFNPVPVYLRAPFVGLYGLSVSTIRLPYAIAGLFVCFLTYILALRLTGKKGIALFAFFIIACNVWAIQLSRMAYEAIFAQLFYLWGTCVFISDWKRHSLKYIVLSMILFFLAFNSYDAMKLVYVPLLIFLILYKWVDIRKNKRILLFLAVGVLITFTVFVFVYFFRNPGVRGSQFTSFQNMEAAAKAVELQRRVSSAPQWLATLYHNKITYFFDIFLHHYLYAFSTDFLFLNQEASGIFSLWSRGNFYLIELPLLLFGMLSLFALKKPAFFLCLGMILISALPSGIGPEPLTYATRSSFMIPWMSVLIGTGAISLIETAKKKVVKYALIGCLIAAYVYSIGGYLNQYYFEWPTYGAEYYSKGVGDLVAYISPFKDNYDTFLISNINDTFVLHYALYNNIDVRSLRQFYIGNPNPLQFQNIRIIPSCLDTDGGDPRLFFDEKTMYITRPDCHEEKPDHIIYLPNNEPQWYIYIGYSQ